jgi:N-acyl-D-aspartate/D-glutamate deacylase
MNKRFYKQNGIWYNDLPEFIDQGLGSLANLMMVDGPDTFLDFLSNAGTEVWVTFNNQHFSGAKYALVAEKFGKNQSLLSFMGHASVNYGCYYTVPELNHHRLWLCPVTEYVFSCGYPEVIWVG